MVFSDTVTLQGLCQETDFLVGTSSTDYTLAQKARNANRWNERATSLILQSDGKMEWDDYNQTDLPVGTMALVANQQDYSPNEAGLLKITKIECKDASGNWNVLKQIDKSQFKNQAMDEYQDVAGDPREVDFVGNTFMLYPKPSFASADGLKIHYQRIPSYFTASDTTKEPGFAPIFHRYLSFGMALDWAMAHNMTTKITIFRDEIQKLEQGIVEFYSSRNRDFKNTITLEQESYSGDSEEGESSVDWSLN